MVTVRVIVTASVWDLGFPGQGAKVVELKLHGVSRDCH